MELFIKGRVHKVAWFPGEVDALEGGYLGKEMGSWLPSRAPSWAHYSLCSGISVYKYLCQGTFPSFNGGTELGPRVKHRLGKGRREVELTLLTPSHCFCMLLDSVYLEQQILWSLTSLDSPCPLALKLLGILSLCSRSSFPYNFYFFFLAQEAIKLVKMYSQCWKT